MENVINVNELAERGVSFLTDEFSDLGEDVNSQPTIDAWFATKCNYSSGDLEYIKNCFDQIPFDRRSLKVCETYASAAPLQIIDIDPSVQGYKRIVVKAVTSDPDALALVHEDHHSEELLKLLISHSVKKLMHAINGTPWARSLMTPSVVEYACRMNPRYVLSMEPEMLTDAALANVVTYGINHFNSIREAGRLELLARPLSQKHWPHGNLVTNCMDRPQGLAHAARLYMSASSEDAEALYIAYMMTHPVEKVLKVLSGGRGAKLLLEMYTSDELKGHLKSSSPSLKGKILEIELGM